MSPRQRADRTLARQIHASPAGRSDRNSPGQRSNSGPSTASAPTFRRALTDLPRHDGLSGGITDDTQMTLFTAEGVIRAAVRYACKGI